MQEGEDLPRCRIGFKIAELSGEGTILLELFASNFVPDGRDSR
jgi:hypothetical protein